MIVAAYMQSNATAPIPCTSLKAFVILMCWGVVGCRNLAGHDTITGDLPAEWYNQVYFPNLQYLKLKGTQIRPKLSSADLTWQSKSNSMSNILEPTLVEKSL
jgi:hypothetical protein